MNDQIDERFSEALARWHDARVNMAYFMRQGIDSADWKREVEDSYRALVAIDAEAAERQQALALKHDADGTGVMSGLRS